MWPCACTQARNHSLHMAMCMHTGREPQFTCGHVHALRQGATFYMWSCACTESESHSLHNYGHVHAHRHRATVYIWSCTCLGGVYRLTTSRKAKTTAGETVYMSLHRQGNSLHIAMCMHTGKKPQFTYGHVHVHRQENTVYIWSCACTPAGSHSLHIVMCMHTGRKSQFTYGHVHAQRQRARVYMWPCVCEGGVYR